MADVLTLGDVTMNKKHFISGNKFKGNIYACKGLSLNFFYVSTSLFVCSLFVLSGLFRT